MDATWDVLVVGAGHNGLVAATYLANTGFQVALIEARDTIGGCSATVNVLNAKVNICNCDHSLIFGSEIIEELALEKFGLEYIPLSSVKQHRLYKADSNDETTRSWWLHRDSDRTVDELAKRDKNLGDQYKKYLAEYLPLAKHFIKLANTIPSTMEILRPGLRDFRLSNNLLRLAGKSLFDVLGATFESEVLAAPAGASVAVWGRSPRHQGTGLAMLGFALGHILPTARPVGGSGALGESIYQAFSAAGGTLILNARVDSLVVDESRICGVNLVDGSRVSAKSVVLTVDPKRFSIVKKGTRHFKRTNRYLFEISNRPSPAGYESKVDAIVDRVPTFETFELNADTNSNSSGVTTLLTPALSKIHDAFVLSTQGEIAKQPIFLANLPDVVDPSMTPPDGGHVFSLEVLYTPYHLRSGWTISNEPQRWIDVFSLETTNDFATALKRWRVMTPPTYEAEFGLTLGYAPSYPGTPLGLILGRPKEATRYRTPIDGLFTCGASTFPGAGIWGVSGRNVSQVVTSYFKAERKNR